MCVRTYITIWAYGNREYDMVHVCVCGSESWGDGQGNSRTEALTSGYSKKTEQNQNKQEKSDRTRRLRARWHGQQQQKHHQKFLMFIPFRHTSIFLKSIDRLSQSERKRERKFIFIKRYDGWKTRIKIQPSQIMHEFSEANDGFGCQMCQHNMTIQMIFI